MGKAKKGPKFANIKRIISSKTIKKHKEEVLNPNKKDLEKEKLPRNVPAISSVLFFKYNTALGPPYRVIVDTNFINFSIQNKLDLEKGMMDCLYAKCTPCITDCVMAELEKLGQKYHVAFRIAKDPRFERLPCIHKGTYADDCIVDRVTQHKCYIVATCDRDLKRRIRKIPGVPIMYITRHRYSIERLPEATMGGGRMSFVSDYLFVHIDHIRWMPNFKLVIFAVSLSQGKFIKKRKIYAMLIHCSTEDLVTRFC
ncbi:putative rRNA-processing protein Fcf1/Utp23 [Dioscorea sansibarensis]